MPERFKEMGYWELVTRQMSIVTKSEQTRFKDAKIAVMGCGGIGGEVIEMLARMGVGELNVVDNDYFDLSNINRQVLSNFENLGLSKSEVAKEKVRQINPYTKVIAFKDDINEENISQIVDDSDIIIDCLDNLLTRVIVSRYAKFNNIPFIHGAIHGTLGQITVFTNEKDIDYETMFNLPSKDKKLDETIKDELNKLASEKPPVIGPTANIVGCMQAIEAFKIITGIGKIVTAPEILNFDLLNLATFSIE
ncbi:molybdopterin-synthase adenylyltransferase [Methanobrevibacter woesei]|uniref:Molybdopterin-synthase adenylyltransferase n=1 Tax=Methanobrevibacter woesei TaxID=190976 RepID=A0A2U1S643_9EURY|nr:HesA/MoeB/ThiF family protein [Methanobrevibacter woesei]PWB85106.1 molybdopterin-synthase adenylyltransferase [Methanobrevibacter woesei]